MAGTSTAGSMEDITVGGIGGVLIGVITRIGGLGLGYGDGLMGDIPTPTMGGGLTWDGPTIRLG